MGLIQGIQWGCHCTRTHKSVLLLNEHSSDSQTYCESESLWGLLSQTSGSTPWVSEKKVGGGAQDFFIFNNFAGGADDPGGILWELLYYSGHVGRMT